MAMTDPALRNCRLYRSVPQRATRFTLIRLREQASADLVTLAGRWSCDCRLQIVFETFPIRGFPDTTRILRRNKCHFATDSVPISSEYSAGRMGVYVATQRRGLLEAQGNIKGQIDSMGS